MNRTQLILDLLLLLCALLILLFCSCSTCRRIACEDALSYQAKGYLTRIAVYKVGTDGLIMGLGMWTHHAQAQVYVGGEWKWVSGGEISDSPEYSIDGEIWYWDAGIYRAFLEQRGKYN